MGMIAYVYRQVQKQLADGTAVMEDCTNGGWSGRFNSVCVVNVEGPFEPSASEPAVRLIQGPGQSANPIIVLDDHYQNGRWTMFGGNFLYTSDSRFSRAVRDLIGIDLAGVGIRIHDRIE